MAGKNKQKLRKGVFEQREFREMTWLPAFHSSGFVTELALTFHSQLVEFQFAFTAQIFVRNTFFGTAP